MQDHPWIQAQEKANYYINQLDKEVCARLIHNSALPVSKKLEGNLESVLRDACSIVAPNCSHLGADRQNEDLPPVRLARNSLEGYPLLIGTSLKS